MFKLKMSLIFNIFFLGSLMFQPRYTRIKRRTKLRNILGTPLVLQKILKTITNRVFFINIVIIIIIM